LHHERTHEWTGVTIRLKVALVTISQQRRWQVDGKFFRLEDHRVVMQSVTYGPFAENENNLWPREMIEDFTAMRACGCNSIRIYRLPTRVLLDAAHAAGLAVWAGIAWAYGMNFRDEPRHLTAARVQLASSMTKRMRCSRRISSCESVAIAPSS
jgi:hypothetical protein